MKIPVSGTALAAVLIVIAAPVQAAPDAIANCADMLVHTGAPESGLASDARDTLCRQGYILSHNGAHNVPDWVLEVLTPQRLKGRANRDRSSFKRDPNLKQQNRGAELCDYKHSGLDRGHMAPAADFKWKQSAMDESFYLSNMAPQVGVGFNRGIWRQLEEQVRDWVAGREPLVVITGPIFEGAGGENATVMRPRKAGKVDPNCDYKVSVPDRFFKIVFDTRLTRAIAFVLPNKKQSDADLKEFVVTIDEIEAQTGIDFFSDFPRRKEKKIERRKSLFWRVLD